MSPPVTFLASRKLIGGDLGPEVGLAGVKVVIFSLALDHDNGLVCTSSASLGTGVVAALPRSTAARCPLPGL